MSVCGFEVSPENNHRSRSRRVWVLLASLALGACGPMTNNSDAADVTNDLQTADSSDGATNDVPAIDASDVQMADVQMQDVPQPDGSVTSCELRRVLVTTTDFTNGGYVLGDLATRTFNTVARPTDGGVPPEQDHVVRTSGCIPFGLWRTFTATTNAVVTLNPDNLYNPVRRIPLEPVSTGTPPMAQAANPYDIAVVSPTRAYVTQYNSPEILIVNPQLDGAAARVGTINLRAVADADGIPEADTITIVGTRAYVTLQRLSRPAFSPSGPGAVAIIDTATDTLVDADPGTTAIDAIPLTFGNPSSRPSPNFAGTLLLVSSSGDLFAPAADGGIDVIDLGMRRVVRSIPGTNASFGADPSSVVAVDANTAWVTVSRSLGDAGMQSRIVAINYMTGEVTMAPIATSATVTFGGLRRAPDGTIWAIDTGFGLSGSIHAFDGTGRALMAMPFATPGFNTYSLDFVP